MKNKKRKERCDSDYWLHTFCECSALVLTSAAYN